jgi:Tfp pilus assembly protein PilF
MLLVLCFEVSGQQATIKEESRSVLTYPFSDPNPVPAMAISQMVSPFYPYYVFDGFSDKGIMKDWKVITLENQYISVTVLPEVGGKVWGATEKSTGGEFVYQNHVLKFRAIGIRGPWTSGGIEHNFGLDLGHAPWTASPVDYLMKKNDDGSVSCIVGGLDLASRSQWRVNILLPADKAYFETRSIWYNPTPLHDAYLSWENGGFRASDDLRFFFPGNFYIGHDGSVYPWPIDDQGRDLSLYKNNDFGTSKSYHVSGFLTGWFGGYWQDADFGFGHSAEYSDVPGKKIWIWSLARDGAIWEDLLTDKDGQYIEAQSGVKFNQANRESGYNSPYNQLSLRPYYTETKTEYWFPVVKTKGMSDASEYGTLNVIPAKDSLNIYICPNSEIKDSLVISLSGKHLFSSFINLKPLEIYHRKISFEGLENKNLRVRIGNNLLSYNSDNKDLVVDRPSKTAKHDYNSAEHLFRVAEDMNAMRDYAGALENYLECLKKEPTHSGALYHIAELCYRQSEYAEGIKYAKMVLENDTYNGGANFIYGICQRSLGKLNEAEEALSIAARTMEYRSAAYLQIAGVKMQRRDYEAANEFAKKSLDFNRYNVPAREILTTSYRKLNNKKESGNSIAELLEIDPLDHYARFEQYLLDPSLENLNNFKALIRNELPYETYLELALEYVNLGLDKEAMKVLEQSPPYPVVFYWLAYLNRNLSAEKSSNYLEKALEMSPQLVFPHRLETIPVLTWAIEKNQSWKSKYYLGVLFWHILKIDKAAELFEECGDIPNWAPFYVARGSLFRNVQTEYCHPCNDFNTAAKMDPGEWRTWHYLTNFLQSNGAFQEELENSIKAYSRFPANPVIGTDHAKALLNSERYSECIAVLKMLKILPQEGAHEGHDIFELANVSLAVSKIEKGKYREALTFLNDSRNWPENLGAGKPYEPDNRFQDYLSAFCYEKLGNRKLADSCNDNIMRYSHGEVSQEQDPLNLFITRKVLNDKGRNEEAGKMMAKWRREQDSLYIWKISSGSSSPKAQWLILKNQGDNGKASQLEKEISSSPTENRFRLYMKILNVNKTK